MIVPLRVTTIVFYAQLSCAYCSILLRETMVSRRGTIKRFAVKIEDFKCMLVQSTRSRTFKILDFNSPCMLLKSKILTAYLLLFLLRKKKEAQACTHSPVHFICYPLALCIEKNSVFINAFFVNISWHKTLCLVFLFGVTSPLHACAKPLHASC